MQKHDVGIRVEGTKDKVILTTYLKYDNGQDFNPVELSLDRIALAHLISDLSAAYDKIQTALDRQHPDGT